VAWCAASKGTIELNANHALAAERKKLRPLKSPLAIKEL